MKEIVKEVPYGKRKAILRIKFENTCSSEAIQSVLEVVAPRILARLDKQHNESSGK